MDRLRDLRSGSEKISSEYSGKEDDSEIAMNYT